MKQTETFLFYSDMRTIEVRAVKSFTGLSAEERREWDSIFDQQSDAVPFQALAWNENWWEVFGRSSPLIERDGMILLVCHHDEIVAFFPMFSETFSLLGMRLLRYVKPIGSDANLTELKTGIVREGYEKDAYAAIDGYFKNFDRRWELLSFPAMPARLSDVDDALSIEHAEMQTIEGFSIELSHDWDAFHSRLKRNVKEAIRKCHNSLKRDNIEPSFTCLSDYAAIRDTLPEFYRLHSERGGKKDGVYHPDYFQTAQARSFIELLARDPAHSGIRLFTLRHDGRLIAARLAFETFRSTYLYYSGYDLEYGKYSIMTRLVVEILKRSTAGGQRDIHLSFGRDGSKTRWSPRHKVYTQYLVAQKSLRGRAFVAFYLAFVKLLENTYRLRKSRHS